MLSAGHACCLLGTRAVRHVVGSGGSGRGKDAPAPLWPQAMSTLQDILTLRQRLSFLKLIS